MTQIYQPAVYAPSTMSAELRVAPATKLDGRGVVSTRTKRIQALGR